MNGGDFIWHLQFADEARIAHAWPRLIGARRWTPVQRRDVQALSGVAYKGGLSGARPVRLSHGVYRTLILAMKPGTNPEAIAKFEHELWGMPKYISSIKNWQLSHVQNPPATVNGLMSGSRNTKIFRRAHGTLHESSVSLGPGRSLVQSGMQPVDRRQSPVPHILRIQGERSGAW